MLTAVPHLVACASVVTCLFFSTLSLHGQGSLTPPGAPAPTMKSLDQIEARTIVSAANTPGDATNTCVINLPGSYYLAGNITGASGKHGISIRADDVTLDLNGFALVGIAPASGTVRGIDVPATQRNLCIRNGTVRGWNGGGVRADAAIGALIEKLRASDNPGASGIAVGNGGLVRDCVATANGSGFVTGDRAQLVGCISTINTGDGFETTNYVALEGCTSSRNGGRGIKTGSSSILRCSATRNDLEGIVAGSGSTIVDCTASFNAGDGMSVPAANVANCSANSNGGHGILAEGGAVINARASFNGAIGILARYGSVATSTASSNGNTGIAADEGTVTNCNAQQNGDNGIFALNGVVAYCKAANNNQSGFGGLDIAAAGATRTGNNPAP